MSDIPPKTSYKKSGKLFIWILAHSREGCDSVSNRLFGQKCVYMCECVLWGMWLYLYDQHLCEWISRDYSDWMRAMNAYEWLYGPYLYDYHLYYRTSVCDYWHINRNQCECLAISVYVWPSEYVLHTKILLLKLFFFFCSGQINHLYEV